MLAALWQGRESQPTFLSRAHFIFWTFIRADYIQLVRRKIHRQFGPNLYFFFLHGSLCLDQPSSNSSCWVGLYYLSEFPPCLGEVVFPKVGDVSLGEEPLPQWGNTVSRLEFIRCTAVRNRVLNRHPEASRHEHTLKQGLNGRWSQLSHPAIPHLQERLSNTAKVPNSVQCWWTRATSPKHRYLTSWE